MQIRELTLQDIPIVMEISRRAIERIYPREYTPEELKAWSEDTAEEISPDSLNDSIAYVAYEEERGKEKIRGYIKASTLGNITRLYVDPSVQRRGIGHLLLSTLTEKLEERGIRSLSVHAALPSLGFYLNEKFCDLTSDTLEVSGRVIKVRRMAKSIGR